MYWDMVKSLLKVEFPGRRHRGSTDPVNSLLNYGYAILLSKVWTSLVLAGLDPYGGFLHVDRPGRPSMALDFMEEFRAPIVDRSVVSFVNRGATIEMEDGGLSQSTRKSFSDHLLKRLDSRERFQRRKLKLKTIIARQAQHLASFLRGERKYEAFVMSW